MPAHTTITVTAHLPATPVTHKKTLYWPDTTATTAAWRYGRSYLITINAKTHTGTVTEDGTVIKRFGVSTGKPGYLTRSGIKTITEFDRVQRMTNAGVTDEEVYDLQVPYAMRITDTGEFLHAAPWNSNIGTANTSHGCTNLSYSTAQWMFHTARIGDPVITTGTTRGMEPWNGPGALWNITQPRW